MDITSWQFGLFVVGVVGVYYLLPRRPQNAWLLAASYAFYVTLAWHFAAVLALMTLANYLIAGRIERAARRRAWLWAGIAFNIAVLALFKYADFFAPQAVSLLHDAGIAVILPVGLSFLVLGTISYLVDVSRGQMAASRSLLDFSLYLAYFPKLTSGPIERARAFLPRLAEPRSVDGEALARGVALIAIGLVRKVIIAEFLSSVIPGKAFTDPDWAGPELALWLLAYGFFIYNDFAGYTSIVRGISALLGIELGPNFAQPYFARSFVEFWNSWHISLSHWLRDYIYFPVSRALLRRNPDPRWLPNIVVAPVLTMLASGLWHGAALNLLVWGLAHGLFQAVERLGTLWQPATQPDRWPRWRQAIGMGSVFILSLLALVPFQLELGAAWAYLRALPERIGPPGFLAWRVLIVVIPALLLDFVQHRAKDEVFFLRWPRPVQVLLLAGALLLVVMTMLQGSIQVFVYQGF